MATQYMKFASDDASIEVGLASNKSVPVLVTTKEGQSLVHTRKLYLDEVDLETMRKWIVAQQKAIKASR